MSLSALPQRVSGRLQREARRLGRRGAVLLYHRVAVLDRDPWGLAVTPQQFDDHLELLGSRYEVVPLRDLPEAIERGRSKRPQVAITFDDGYLDNSSVALPALERHDLHGTFFFVSGAIASGQEFWWDDVERLVFDEPDVPSEVAVSIGGDRRQWPIVGDSDGGGVSWRGWQDPASARHAVFQEMWGALQSVPASARVAAREELWSWRGGPPEARPSHRLIGADDLAAFAAHDLVDVGAHSVSHPRLSSLPPDLQRQEVMESKRWLEERVGPIATFSYPHGDHADFTEDSVRAVRDAGFELACAAYAGIVRHRTDRFRIPRINIEPWGVDELQRQLSHWLPD